MNKIVQILLLASVLSLVSSRQWFHDVKATSLTDQVIIYQRAKDL